MVLHNTTSDLYCGRCHNETIYIANLDAYFLLKLIIFNVLVCLVLMLINGWVPHVSCISHLSNKKLFTVLFLQFCKLILAIKG